LATQTKPALAVASPRSAPPRGLLASAQRWIPLALILLGALVIRLWGIDSRLPFIFGPDERINFVPKAVLFFNHGYNPGYFVNPPAFTYLLHLVFAVRFGGSEAVRVFQADPAAVYLVARLTSAALGTLAVFLIFILGARLFDRATGLLAALVMAFAFLPVGYSHFAVNDMATVVPVTISLIGTAGVLKRGRLLDYVIAGAGVGLAGATKYTGAIVVLPLLIASIIRLRGVQERRNGLVLLGIAAAASLGAFFVANPVSLIDVREFVSGLPELRIEEKLGTRIENGILHYLWTLTWGLGWVPLVAAMAGGLLLVLRNRVLAAVLLPTPVVYLLFMGSRTRFFARWALPIYPILILLAAYAGRQLLTRVGRWSPRLVAPVAVVGSAALILQGTVHSVHTDMVLQRSDTRELARAWAERHIPAGSRIVDEGYGIGLEEALPGAPPLTRWTFLSPLRLFSEGIGRPPARAIDLYGKATGGRVLFLFRPELIDEYLENGVCWVVTSSSISGRAFNDPETVPLAIAYYHELERRGRVAYRILPYSPRLPFEFAWENLYYPFQYHRPGPELTIYRLPGRGC
jgi:hypothetical protein